MKCRICGSDTLIEYLDLGLHPPSDAFLTREQLGTEKVFPLTLLYCDNCSLSQLGYVVPCEELYTNDYPYETGMNNGGVEHFRDMANTITERFKPGYVVDIGSNDGTLLEGFTCKTCGIEPVSTIAEKARVYTVNDFFSSYACDQALTHGGKADIITACNVFAHVDNLHGFMWCVDRLLAEKGVFIIEAPYLPDMVKNLAFDTVYHEHLSYLSLKPLCHLFRQYNMEIFDVKHSDVHCGTMRYYVARRGTYPISSAVDRYFEAEQDYHNIKLLRGSAFAFNIFLGSLSYELNGLKANGKRIVGVSAPAKGNTLLNSCILRDGLFDYITEKSERKIGRYTPGTHILVVPDSKLIEDQPDYAIIFAHNWEKQIKSSLKDYKGEWINANKFKDLRGRTFGISRECDCSGTETKGLHECCRVQG